MFWFDAIWGSPPLIQNVGCQDSVLTVSCGLHQKPWPNNPKRLPHHITLVEDVLDINHSMEISSLSANCPLPFFHQSCLGRFSLSLTSFHFHWPVESSQHITFPYFCSYGWKIVASQISSWNPSCPASPGIHETLTKSLQSIEIKYLTTIHNCVLPTKIG